MKINKILQLAKNYLSPLRWEKDKRNFEAMLEGLEKRGEEPDEKMLWQSQKKVLDRLRKSGQEENREGIIMILSRYAASFLIIGILSIGYFYVSGIRSENPSFTVKETIPGMRSTVTLADGSVVRLNERSKLEYPEAFGKQERTVRLYGEAFFDIQPDPEKPFKVLSKGTEVTVLGTSFNINTFRETEITVTTGKVKVADIQTNQQINLREGQQAILNKDAIQVYEVNPSLFVGWHTRKLDFEHEPIGRVFDILERAYGVKIVVRSRQQDGICLITGFYEGEKIETIFKGLKHLVDFEYDMDPASKTIWIDLNRCKQ